MKTDFTKRVTSGGPNMPVKAAPAEEIIAGQTTVTTAGTPVRLYTAQSLEAGVHIKALAGNSGDIYVMHSEGAANGYVLDAGESVFFEINDLSKVWLDTSNSGDGVSFLGS